MKTETRMRTFLFGALVPSLLLLSGCASRASYVRSPDTTLGRIVIYRNGVAYFERFANVPGSELHLAVPGDKVDDFLKSLTVVDAVTGEPTPIAYPTDAPAGSGTVDMHIQLPGPAPHRLKLSYVTESPSWKPSYRVTLGDHGKVGLQAWAIVDNTSGEDWNQVKLGVGASSAMSFRFDLRSVRLVERQTLQAEDLFALAPPTGESTYGGKVTFDLGDGALALNAPPAPPPTVSAAAAAPASAPSPAAPSRRGGNRGRASAPTREVMLAETDSFGDGSPGGPPNGEAARFASVANALRSSSGQIVVQGYASADDRDKQGASLERANKAREELVRAGIEANRIVAVGKGVEAGHTAGVRVALAPKPANGANEALSPAAREAAEQPGDPIGTSHFESTATMSVARGSSAMVSILNAPTDGEVVYLYDPETSRGNTTYAFRAVHVKNPTDSALESGPVTVFGDGKFIGEGMCDPIPGRASAFVPFALDRQIVVEHKDYERDAIAQILTVQRGVLSTEVRHTRFQTITLHNRLPEKAIVYVRHTVAPSYKLADSPAPSEHMGTAQLFRVEVPANGKIDLTLTESTPVTRTTDLRTPEGLDLVKAFVSADATDGNPVLKASVAQLLDIHRSMANIEAHIATTREQMEEYRARMDELHAQIVTLKVVKTAGPLMQSLEKKMQEMSDKVSKGTLDLVALEEGLMVAKVRFQDTVADLTLEAPKEGAKRAAL
jgi:hypothetical protein